jgi:DeoR family transcriptional regulator, fructose operon transcriptional repressor
MTTYERRQSLMQLLQKQPGLRVPELAKALDVSRGTIRNDLDALEGEGYLTRVHGGAVLKKKPVNLDSSFGLRFQEHAEAKMAIARVAAKLVTDGASILLDASTTVYYLAQELSQYHRLRVLTNGIEVARLLAKDPTNTVVLMGGIVSPEGASVAGNFSEQLIHDLHVQKAFVSCSGFSLERGLTDVHLAEAQLKGKAIASAREVFALIDSSKIGIEDLTPFASLEQVTHLYTDSGLSEAWVAQLENAGVHFSLCQN